MENLIRLIHIIPEYVWSGTLMCILGAITGYGICAILTQSKINDLHDIIGDLRKQLKITQQIIKLDSKKK